jgi:branched-chain amino acid transport system ATP-binding protein
MSVNVRLLRTLRWPQGHSGRQLDEIARRGTAILLVEQKLTIALKISHRLYVMGHGRIVFAGSPADLMANTAVRKEWLEV